MLLRLRQVCCSRNLVPTERLLKAKALLEERADQQLSAEEAERLLTILRGALSTREGGDLDIGTLTECVVCLQALEGAENIRIVRLCGHFFCSVCMEGLLRSSLACPLCRTIFTGADVIEGSVLEKSSAAASDPEREAKAGVAYSVTQPQLTEQPHQMKQQILHRHPKLLRYYGS
jgi:hypothetical protein